MMDKDTAIKLSSIDAQLLYTVEELAPLFRVSQRTLRRYCMQKVFENASKIGGKHWLIPGCDVIALCPYLAKENKDEKENDAVR